MDAHVAPTPSTGTVTVTVTDELPRPGWLPRDVWPFALRRHRVLTDDGPIDVHYTDEGSGPVLLFVHAGFWSFVWRDLVALLSDDFRCITLDMPGAGLSGGGEEVIDLDAYAGVAHSLLDALAVEEASLVIHDLGGVVGVLAAGLRPERVVGIAAVNTFAWRPDTVALRGMINVVGSPVVAATLGNLRVLPRISSTRVGVGRALDERARTAFLGPYGDRARSRGFHRTMRSAALSPGLFDRAQQVLRTDLADRPVLTVFGENNDPFGFADRWRRMFPRAQSWVVAGGNHFPMCDDAPGLAARLRDWHAVAVAGGERR